MVPSKIIFYLLQDGCKLRSAPYTIRELRVDVVAPARSSRSWSTPPLPFKSPQIPSHRDHKALNMETLGGAGGA